MGSTWTPLTGQLERKGKKRGAESSRSFEQKEARLGELKHQSMSATF